MSSLDHLRDAVAAISTVIDSAEALIAGLAERLRAALDNGDWDAVEGLADDLDDHRATLAAAVAANTVPEAPAPEATA